MNECVFDEKSLKQNGSPRILPRWPDRACLWFPLEYRQDLEKKTDSELPDNLFHFVTIQHFQVPRKSWCIGKSARCAYPGLGLFLEGT